MSPFQTVDSFWGNRNVFGRDCLKKAREDPFLSNSVNFFFHHFRSHYCCKLSVIYRHHPERNLFHFHLARTAKTPQEEILETFNYDLYEGFGVTTYNSIFTWKVSRPNLPKRGRRRKLSSVVSRKWQ